MVQGIEISIDDLSGGDVIALLEEHLEDMYATSPPESVHALDVTKLKASDITFFAARTVENELAGCIAIKELDNNNAEIKSMRTPKAARKRGVAKQLLSHLISHAKGAGYSTLWLETGSMAFFEPARQLYLSYGFEFCGPFGDYKEDPNSCFMNKRLQ